MISKKLSLVILIFLLTSLSFSQKNTGKFIMFKLYKSAVFDVGNTQANSTVSLSNFTPGIAWGEGANFHEVQITSFNFFSRARSTFLYSGGAEYTYNHQFSDNEDSKFQFFFGGGFGAGFSTKNSSVETANSVFVPTVGKFINLNVVAIPRITYDIINNISLEVSLSYNLLDFENSTQKAADPSLPPLAQSNSYNELRFFPGKFSLRVGGIVKF